MALGDERRDGDSLPIDLPEHDVEAAQDGGDVGQHVAAVHEVHGLQMGKPGARILQR